MSTKEALLEEMVKADKTLNYQEMKEKFTPYDCVDGVAIFCAYLFRQKAHETIQETRLFNGKETANVLSGGFWDNGVTTALSRFSRKKTPASIA